ncbi:MAG: DUF3109 family protein, partial [Bacteroidales bacterium]
MLQIKDTLISQDIIEQNFCCDLTKCHGACCVKGDAGAPLLEEETDILSGIIEKIKPYLSEGGIKSIERQGTHVIDSENETVTPLIDGKECAYVVFENGIARCGIEKAWSDGAVKFRKPVSCHLYPVRIRKYERFIAVNYDQWDICGPARKKGDTVKLPVIEFVKDALIRRFGKDWYLSLKKLA